MKNKIIDDNIINIFLNPCKQKKKYIYIYIYIEIRQSSPSS